MSRCPGLLILVPKRRRAWCAAPCAILASEESLLVLVRQQRHTRAASPHASNRFSNSLRKVSSNEEISASLFISVRTVEHHVSAILVKLGTTRKGAAKEALKLGLTPRHRSPVAARNLGSRPPIWEIIPHDQTGRSLLRSFSNLRPKEERCRSTWISTASTVQ